MHRLPLHPPSRFDQREPLGDPPDARRVRVSRRVQRVAAREAEQGHGALAHDIREIVDKAKRDARRQRSAEISARLVWHGFFGKSRYPFFSSGASRRPKLRLKGRIQRIMREHREQEELKSHGLSNRRKILVAGLPAKR